MLPEQQSPGDDDGLLTLLHALRQHWILVLLVALPVTLGAVVYAESLSSEYEATAVATFAPDPEADVSADVLRLLLGKYSVYATSNETLGAAATALDIPPEDLTDGVSVSAPPDTSNLRVAVKLSSPTLAAVVANRLADQTVLLTVADPLVDGLVVARAAPPREASGPPRRLLELAAGAAGLLGGVAVALTMHRLRPRVFKAADIERHSDAPLLGVLSSNKAFKRPVGVLLDPVASQVRTLRTNLARRLGSSGSQVLLVTSAAPGHGSTTVSALLAGAFAAVDRRTLVIDADLHNGGLAKRLGLEPRPGLAEVLRGEAKLEGAIRRDYLPGMSVLQTTVDVDAGDLVARRLAPVLQSLRTHYDLIVVDSPSLDTSDIPRTVATLADAVVIVVRVGARLEELLDAVSTVRRLDAQLVGVVANRGRRAEAGGGFPRRGGRSRVVAAASR